METPTDTMHTDTDSKTTDSDDPGTNYAEATQVRTPSVELGNWEKSREGWEGMSSEVLDYVRTKTVDGNVVTIDAEELTNTLPGNPDFQVVYWVAQVCVKLEYSEAVSANFINVGDETTIEDLRVEQSGEIVQIDARITNRTGVYPLAYSTVFKCEDCHTGTRTVQNYRPQSRLEQPTQCHSCVNREDKGAGSFGKNAINTEKTEMTDAQEVIVQDRHQQTATVNPADSAGIITEGLVQRADTGDNVTVYACLRTEHRKRSTNDFELYLEVIGIEHEDKEYDGVEITERDEERIRSIAGEDGTVDKLAASIAPGLRGDYTAQRKAALLMLAGGGNLGDERRSTIHTAFVGDPSTGKSHLAESIAAISPKSEYASGDSSSAVGLTATVDEVQQLDGAEWMVRGGVVVRADGGHAIIDELDKAAESEQMALNTPLSQQKVEVNKADINATLSADCSVLLVANPSGDRFSMYDELSEQIDIRPSLLSRMDVICPFVDEADDADKEREIALEIMEAADQERELSTKDLRKYIAYIRRNYSPGLTQSAKEAIAEWFGEMRTRQDEGGIAIDRRKMWGTARLATAVAKLNLREAATVDDVQKAIDLMESWMRLLLTDASGNLDVDQASANTSHSQKERVKAVYEAINEYKSGLTIQKDKVVGYASQKGIKTQQVHQTINAICAKDGHRVQHGSNHPEGSDDELVDLR